MVLVLKTPTIHRISVDFMRIKQNLADLSYKVCVRSLKNVSFIEELFSTRDLPGVALLLFSQHFSQLTEKSNFLLELPFY